MSEGKQYYGWFSPRAAEDFGTFFYTTPSGETVEVTEVSTDPEGHGYKWSDKVAVGKVGEFIRQGREGRIVYGRMR